MKSSKNINQKINLRFGKGIIKTIDLRTYSLLLYLFMMASNSFSQDTLLSLNKAIEISLTNNYDIRIIRNIAEQSENNNSIGNAGMLPDVDLNGSYTRYSNSLKQKYSSGEEVNRDASVTTNTFADAGVVWTIFDGTKMFITKEKLSEQSLISQDQLKIQIENSLTDVISAYYTIVRQHQQLKALQEELKLSDERVKISERKMQNGSGSRLDWLQNKTDHNRQRSLEIALNSEIDKAKYILNLLMGRNFETEFATEDTVIFNYNPVFENLKKAVNEQNNLLSYYKRNQRIAELSLKENKSLRSPIIKINSHYTFIKNNSEAGFTLLNQTQGINFGATATIPIFHGFDINRQIKNSKLDVLNSELDLEYENAKVNADLYNGWREFQNTMELLKIEEENILYAREVLSVSQERYKVGMSNIVELTDAQRTFETATIRLTDARYYAKISETNLKKLTGELVNNKN